MMCRQDMRRRMFSIVYRQTIPASRANQVMISGTSRCLWRQDDLLRTGALHHEDHGEHFAFKYFLFELGSVA